MFCALSYLQASAPLTWNCLPSFIAYHTHLSGSYYASGFNSAITSSRKPHAIFHQSIVDKDTCLSVLLVCAIRYRIDNTTLKSTKIFGSPTWLTYVKSQVGDFFLPYTWCWCMEDVQIYRSCIHGFICIK